MCGKLRKNANPRREGVLLDFAASVVKGAPKTIAKRLTVKNDRALFHVREADVKVARDLLGRVVEQS